MTNRRRFLRGGVLAATAGPGYAWHCHVMEHENNEMMRPYVLKP